MAARVRFLLARAVALERDGAGAEREDEAREREGKSCKSSAALSNVDGPAWGDDTSSGVLALLEPLALGLAKPREPPAGQLVGT